MTPTLQRWKRSSSSGFTRNNPRAAWSHGAALGASAGDDDARMAHKTHPYFGFHQSSGGGGGVGFGSYSRIATNRRHGMSSSSSSLLATTTTTTTKTTTSSPMASSARWTARDADNQDDDDDTVFALSSSSSSTGSSYHQPTAVAVIRMTGPSSGAILQQLTQRSSLPKPRYATLCKLYEPISRQQSPQSQLQIHSQLLDQALVLWFPRPASFTGQDVVELHCHGSRAVVQGVLQALSQCGARLAEPGEFTQRAFAAGKLGLLQVEALADLIAADTSTQRTLALQQLEGRLSEVYQDWRNRLIAGLAHAEAVIDFGDDERLDDTDDDDIEHTKNGHDDDAAQWSVWGNVVDRMRDLRQSMSRQLANVRGELVREGVHICLIGPPNAGKSSLFNLLASRPAAIVSSTAGTTRDVLEISLNLAGVKCILQDTAGLRQESLDEIEVEGMKRAAQAASSADLVVALLDMAAHDNNSATKGGGWETEWNSLQTILTSHQVDLSRVLLVLNKSDLKSNGDAATSRNTGDYFEISCKTQQGVDAFLTRLTERVMERVTGTDDTTAPIDDLSAVVLDGTEDSNLSLITRARHRQHVQAAVEALERFDALSQQGTMAVDLAAEELRLAASELGRILGAVDVEDVLDKLFTDFCIGK